MLVPGNVLLSIVIPTFNSAEHLQECLDSIKNQEWDNYEVLIIDSKSKDGTIEIIERNRLNFSRLTFISEKDKGVYDAMNKGIKASCGNWLYFLGSDDRLIDQNTLGSIFEIIDRSNADVVYGNVKLSTSGQIYAGPFDDEKIYEMNISHQAIFFKRTVFNVVGEFDLIYKSNADWVHNFKWFFNPAIEKIYLDKVVAVYSENGISSWYIDKVFKQRKEKLYLKHAGHSITKAHKLHIIKLLVINRKNSRRYLEYIWYSSVLFLKNRFAGK